MGDLKSSVWNGTLFYGPVVDYSPYCRKNTIKSTFSAEILKVSFLFSSIVVIIYNSSGHDCMELNMIAYKVIINKSFNNMFNVFRMELNLIVDFVTITYKATEKQNIRQHVQSVQNGS